MTKTDTFDKALEMLETFSEIGLTLAPAEATDYMANIGAWAGDVDKETALKIYRFMIDAAIDEHCQLENSELVNSLPDQLNKEIFTR